jgi:hypothetical protein
VEDQYSVGRRIRIMCEVDGGLPLWDDEGRLWEENSFAVDFLGLSPSLVDELRSWSDQYADNRIGDRDEWRATGARLRSGVEDALGSDFEVVLILPTWSDEA